MPFNPDMTASKTRLVMLATWALLPCAYCLPKIRLDTALAAWVVRFTSTGSVWGIVILGLILIPVLVFRDAFPWRRRLREILIHIIALALIQGGGALVNEYLLKPSLAVPRPNIVWLAEEGALGMTSDHFYSSMDRQERRTYLEHVLTDPGFEAIALRDEVRDHWIHESGFSMPSGHAFSAMLFATYLLVMGMRFLTGWRRWVFYLLPGWAILIGWSRVLLRVHRPVDVLLGGLIGIVLGVLALCLTRQTLHWLKTRSHSCVPS